MGTTSQITTTTVSVLLSLPMITTVAIATTVTSGNTTCCFVDLLRCFSFVYVSSITNYLSSPRTHLFLGIASKTCPIVCLTGVDLAGPS